MNVYVVLHLSLKIIQVIMANTDKLRTLFKTACADKIALEEKVSKKRFPNFVSIFCGLTFSEFVICH